MNQATELNAAPENVGHFKAQIDGMATAAVYILSFGWTHLESNVEFVSATVLAFFLTGLIVIPLAVCLPAAPIRNLIAGAMEKQSAIGAAVPFAQFAIYALQVVLVWIVTREAYAWIFAAPSLG